MLKVKNKKVIDEVAWTTYKANKKRNLLTVFAISLTTFLIAVVLAVGVSYWNTISQRQLRMQGMDYDIELREPREDQVETIRAMDGVKYAGVAVKCAVLRQYQDKTLEKTRLYYLDETCWEKQTVPALESYEGSYPEKENEIMFSTTTLKSMGIQEPEIGMKLPLSYYTLAEDSTGETLEKEFILSGWYRDYSGQERGYISRAFWETTGVKQTDFTQGFLKITLKNPLYSEKDIIRMQNAIDLDRNQLIEGDADTIANFCRITAGLAVMLLMIFASGYLFIYNTLYISISKDIRYYGQLKTVGMTSVQLKRMVYRQAIWNAAAGIPLGLLAAALVARIAVPQVLHMVNPVFAASDIVSVGIWVYLLAGGFAFFTDLVSCKKPAKIAGDCSPIEALRYIVGRGGKKGRRREWGSVYSMAAQNMFRDKKQAVVIFASFIIAISIYLVVNVIIRGNDARLILNELYSYDIEFKNETTLEEDRQQLITEDKISRIEKTDGVKGVSRVTSAEAVIPYQEEVYGTYYKELYQTRYSPGNYEEDMELYRQEPDSPRFNARFISVDERGFEVLNEGLGNVLDREAFEKGEIAVAIKGFTEGDNGITGKTVQFYLPEGKEPAKAHTIQIAAVGGWYNSPAYFAGGYSPDLVVSEEYAKELLGEPFTELIRVEYERAYSSETEEQVKAVFANEKEISYNSKLEQYQEMKNTENQVKVLGNSIGFIIAMLAVLNYLNMMASSVQNRSKEFATLESIGMTASQIRKMLRAEGIGYAAISILISLLIGLPMSYVVFNGINQYQTSYSLPWINNLILFIIIIVLCMTAPVLIFRRTQNLSIIERLRRGDE